MKTLSYFIFKKHILILFFLLSVHGYGTQDYNGLSIRINDSSIMVNGQDILLKDFKNVFKNEYDKLSKKSKIDSIKLYINDNSKVSDVLYIKNIIAKYEKNIILIRE